ncbi:hypothetical protein C8R46DRAFT_1094326 [Mycena filopes]|nr:hypothetical protein C8R46DRAFT_1094326 [Mycena filopes]
MVETQLLRSGAVTLTVTIDCQTGGAKKDLLNSIKLCVAQSHRWATLSLQGQDFILGRIFPLLLPVQGRLNTLSKLELLSTLERPGAADPFAIPPDPDTLYNPLLSLGGTLHLPFAQLAYFHGFFPSQSQALKALRAARSMVKFAVSFVHVGASPPIVVILPKLRYLSVAAPEHSDFLSGVEAPGLEGLCVRDHADLPEFIQRSSCQLTKLVVHRCSEPGDLVDVLRSLPTLTTLFVGFASDVLSAETRPLFNALKARNGTTEVCPNLTHLAVDGPPEFGVNAFVEMAASRWFEVKPSPLVFVRVFRGLHTSTHARVPKRVLDCLRKMREEGLDAGFESRVDFSPESLLGFGTLKI